MKPGALYCAEDWVTGYWADGPDGAAFAPFVPQLRSDPIESRIPTRDYGMVGFVKYLVDEVASAHIRESPAAPLTRPDRLEFVHVHKPAVVMKKAARSD